jgi:hypothetical protein
LSVNEIGNIIPKTPEATLVVAQAYLLTTQPAPRDPWEGMHQAAIKGLELIGDNYNRNFRDRIKHRIAPNRIGEAEGHNLRTTHHNLTDPNHW